MVEPDGIDFLCLFLGIAAVGACAPVNPALSRSELEFYLPDLQPDALVVRRLDSPAAAQGRLRSLKILETGQLLAEAAKVLPGVPSDGPEPEDVALLLHTSATTGRAKLVPLTHREVLAMAENTATLLGLNRQDRFLSMMPLFHLQGLISAVAQLNRGGSVVATPGLDPVRFPAWMEEFRPTWYTAAPALHGAILPVARREKERIRNAPLRFVRSIGARLAPQLLAGVEEALGVPVLEGNGLTETGMVTSNPLPPGRRLPGSAGTAAAAEVAILDEQGVPVEPGRQGQIAVRGPTVFSGYRNDDEANRAAFRDGWFLTGDLGWLDKEGYLFIDGRLKEMINRGGAKVLPGEVDDWLMAHPAVARAAAFAMPHPMLGEEVAAAVVLRAGASATAAELRRYAASQLSSFKVPRRILFLDALPVSATGKPVRAKLAEMLAAEVRSCQPPQTETQKRLARVWEKVLGVERVGLHDDFFSLGGDSFALTLLMTELEIEFGTAAVGLQDSEFFASPDLENLAGLLDGHSSARHPIGAPQRPPYIALQREGARQPFFCIPGADENPYYFRELAQCLGEDRPFYVIRDPQPIEERELLTLEQSAVRYAAVIRSLRPRGPYVVGGHCFGGVLAFEIARELMRRGERVARVVLFETPAPGHPKVLRHWRRYGRVAAGILTGRRRVSRNEIFAHLGLLLSLGRRRMPVLSALSLPDTHPNVRAMAAYRPRRLDCAVTQFVATAEFHRTEILDCPLRAWREYAGSEFDLQETAGPAEAIFRYPHVRTLAEKLREVLGRIEEGQ
jgi:acyl-CoA synthetase (AMP-forming)/AMP-acid ligase II/thioesterase domain-containing protein